MRAGAAATRNSRARSRRRRERRPVRCAFYAFPIALLAVIAFSIYSAAAGAITLVDGTAWSSIALSLLFPSMVFAYLLAKGNTLKGITDQLGLSRKRFAVKYVGAGILVFLSVLAVEFGIGAFEAATGISLPTNVQQALAGVPLYFLLFSFLVAPIDEEILFRGFLVPRIGIAASSAIFAAVHYISYFSISEVIAAFLFGLVSGYVFKRTRSLYPSVIGHALVNALGLAAAFL